MAQPERNLSVPKQPAQAAAASLHQPQKFPGEIVPENRLHFPSWIPSASYEPKLCNKKPEENPFPVLF